MSTNMCQNWMTINLKVYVDRINYGIVILNSYDPIYSIYAYMLQL